MLTHQVPCINILNSTQFKPFILARFHANNTWTFLSNQCKPGLFLTVSKLSSGLSVGSPTDNPLIKHRSHFVKPKSMAISGLIHTKHNLQHKSSHNHPKQSLHCPKQVQHIPTIWSQVLGQIKRSLTALINPSINKILKQGVDQVGENPYIPKFVETS